MHRKSSYTLALLAALSMSATTVADMAIPTPMQMPAKTDDSETLVDIPDPALRRAVEGELGKEPGDPITRGEMESLEWLYSESGVRQLEGIEYAVNLSHLLLRNGAISDVSALAGLTLLTTLDLSDNEISNLAPLAGLTSLTELRLPNNSVVDIAPLAGMRTLTGLWLGGSWASGGYENGNAISDVSPLAGMASLTTLDLSDNEIASLAPLAGLTSLTELRLPNNAVMDVAPLASLTSLTVLDLDGCHHSFIGYDTCNSIPDVAALAGMTSLTYLALSDNAIADVSALAGMTSLTYLALSGNAIADASPLSDMRSLTEFHLSDNTIADVSALAGMTSLTYLALSGNAIADVSPLAGMRSLTELHLSDNAIADVSALAGMTSLTYLALSGNAIADVSPLAGMRSLTELHLSRNRIQHVSPLARLISLTRLGLAENEITELGPLEDLTSLRSLWLGNNAIADVSALAGMTSLTYLALSGNAIAEVSPLAGMRSLTELHLSDNAIADVSALAGMTSLTYLALSGNAIADVSPLAGMRSLTELHLSDNAIADVSALAGMTSLTYLALSGNAIADVSPLAGMRSLTELHLSDNTIADVSALAGTTSLTYLALSGNAIADVSPLAGMRSLTDLHLSRNRIQHVSPLARLISLTRLGLAENEITELGPLEDLTSLRSLWLGNNEIADVSTLAGMTSLTELLLSGNEVEDLSPLTGVRSLMYLDLARNAIVDVSALAGMTSLTYLDLSSNAIWDVSPLVGLTSLTRLDLGGNEIIDVSPLTGLTSLADLSLVSNLISDLRPLVATEGLGPGDSVDLDGNPLTLESRTTYIPMIRQRGVEVRFHVADATTPTADEMPDSGLRQAVDWAIHVLKHSALKRSADFAALLRLDASNRGIVDLAGLEAASEIVGLNLDGNEITDISPLAELRLGMLTLADNMVVDWAPLAGLTELRFLALDGNSLLELPPLPPALRHLYLANNSVSDVAALVDLGEIRELDISGNSITSLTPLSGMEHLRYLHVHDNQVADISSLNFAPLRELHMANNVVRDISPLLGSERLLMVDVRGNPLADDGFEVIEILRERRVTVLAGETVPYFPAAGEARQGFVRVVNRSDEAGHAFIEAVDDAGERAGPVRLELGTRQAVHFNSADLEYGNADKGLAGIGAPTAGDWRLFVISALDVEVLSYIRTEDGFVTAMHEVAADAMAPFFNPGSNRNQRSILRVVNTEAEPAKWTTGGYDDRGNWHPMAGSLLVRPQHALTLTAQELENAHGLGDGKGKWRLWVRGFPWFAMSLLESPTGHLTNLSTAPAHTTQLDDGATLHRLPLFPAAGGAREGFARLINRSYSSGEVTISAVDDAGGRSGPVRLTMRPRRAVHFNSVDLEGGNAAKGLVGSVGVGEGDWRLEITSELDLMALVYARTTDGFLTSLHDLAPVAEDGSHRVVFFNPGSNTRQVSKLRLINDGERRARVTITGIDDQGNGSGRVVGTVPAGSVRTLTAAELEAGGEHVAGSLGDGEGKWRLRVRSEEPIAVMSLLETPSGHLTNVSTGTAD